MAGLQRGAVVKIKKKRLLLESELPKWDFSRIGNVSIDLCVWCNVPKPPYEYEKHRGNVTNARVLLRGIQILLHLTCLSKLRGTYLESTLVCVYNVEN